MFEKSSVQMLYFRNYFKYDKNYQGIDETYTN